MRDNRQLHVHNERKFLVKWATLCTYKQLNPLNEAIYNIETIIPQGLYKLLILIIFYNCDYKHPVQKQINNALRHKIH